MSSIWSKVLTGNLDHINVQQPKAKSPKKEKKPTKNESKKIIHEEKVEEEVQEKVEDSEEELIIKKSSSNKRKLIQMDSESEDENENEIKKIENKESEIAKVKTSPIKKQVTENSKPSEQLEIEPKTENSNKNNNNNNNNKKEKEELQKKVKVNEKKVKPTKKENIVKKEKKKFVDESSGEEEEEPQDEEEDEVEENIKDEENQLEEEEEEIEEEYESETEEVDKKTTITTTTTKVKFQRKVPVSKKKSTAKIIQNTLKELSNYHPIKDAGFEKDKPVPYLILAKVFERIEETSSRLLIVEFLTNLFRSIILLSPNELTSVIYLCINRTGPSYDGKELGIGETILMKAVSDSTGRTMEFIKQELKEVGDLGIIAQNSKMTQATLVPPPPLTINKVIGQFRAIADLSGNASQNKKKDLIRSLLVSCRDCESLYIIRSLQSKLRIGLAERSVLLALAKATLITPSNQNLSDQSKLILDKRKVKEFYKTAEDFEVSLDIITKKVTRAYSQLPNYDLLVPEMLKSDGLEKLLETCSLKVGIPVKPMLAQPTTGISQVLDRFEGLEFTCEYKYDGERAQIHKTEDGKILVYTRNLEDYTPKYPDILANVPLFMGPNVKSFILDCEAVAFDKESKKILSFQILSTRARKSVQLSQIKVPVCVFAFDLLFLNGQSLIDEPLSRRRELLKENFIESTGVLAFAKYSNISDINDIQTFLEEAIQGNCEGLMVKTLKDKSIYEPSRRSYNWLKIKKDYLQGMTDSLDLVPIGAWYGKGKRTGTYGAYLLACYDEENDEYQTVCKIGTGFSDEQLTTFTESLKSHVIPNPRNMFRVNDQLKPDVWLSPTLVWEVMAADLSISPTHTGGAGLVDPVKGIALRFPRFIRIRADKSPEDATSAEQVVEMYRNQKINNSSIKEVNEDY